MQHRILANCEGDRYSSPTDIGIDGKTLLFEINDLLVDTSQAVKFNNESQASNLYSKRVMKMVSQNLIMDSYQKNEMLSKNSSMWFLNSHRLVSLEKILTAYVSNYREIYEVLNKEDSLNILHKCVIFQTKSEGFSNVLAFYHLLKLVCEYQNQIRFFEFGAH